MLLLPMVCEPDEVVKITKSCSKRHNLDKRMPLPEQDPESGHRQVGGSDIRVSKPEERREGSCSRIYINRNVCNNKQEDKENVDRQQYVPREAPYTATLFSGSR